MINLSENIKELYSVKREWIDLASNGILIKKNIEQINGISLPSFSNVTDLGDLNNISVFVCSEESEITAIIYQNFTENTFYLELYDSEEILKKADSNPFKLEADNLKHAKTEADQIIDLELDNIMTHVQYLVNRYQ